MYFKEYQADDPDKCFSERKMHIGCLWSIVGEFRSVLLVLIKILRHRK